MHRAAGTKHCSQSQCAGGSCALCALNRLLATVPLLVADFAGKAIELSPSWKTAVSGSVQRALQNVRRRYVPRITVDRAMKNKPEIL